MDVSEPLRIAVLGSYGSGKTTLARKLALRYGLPLYHIDDYRDPITHRATHELALMHRRWMAENRWVIDGNYLKTLPERAAMANSIILLDVHPLVCMWRAFCRELRHGSIPIRFLLSILSWRRRHRGRIIETIGAVLGDGGHGLDGPLSLR